MAKDKGRPGIMFYFDLIQPLLTQLSDEQAGQLFRAAFNYAQYGVLPSFEPGMIGMAWALLQPAIDRDSERYNDTILQRKYAVYVREQKRNKVEPIPFEDFKRLSDNDRCQSLSTDSTDNDNHRPITDDNGRYPTTISITKATTKATPTTTSTSKTKSITPTAPTPVAAATANTAASADIDTERYNRDHPYVWEATPEGLATQLEDEDDLPF